MYYLSPYEFVRYWDIKLLSYPKALKDVDNPKHHVHMTEVGLKKLSASEGPQSLAKLDLKAGIDYQVLDAGDSEGSWLPFPDTEGSRHFRHQWILARRSRPCVPFFAGSPMPRPRGLRWVTECNGHNDILPSVGAGREHGVGTCPSRQLPAH